MCSSSHNRLYGKQTMRHTVRGQPQPCRLKRNQGTHPALNLLYTRMHKKCNMNKHAFGLANSAGPFSMHSACPFGRPQDHFNSQVDTHHSSWHGMEGPMKGTVTKPEQGDILAVTS